MGRTLGQFALIVFGVFAALSAETWISERGDQQLAGAYLEDLQVDLWTDSVTQDEWGAAVRVKIIGLEALLSDLNGTGPRLTAPEALLSLAYGAVVPTSQLSQATYFDLVGSGNLRLLSAEHRSVVVGYYTAASTFDRRLALYEGQGKPRFTGLIPGGARNLGSRCALVGPLTLDYECLEDVHESFVNSMPPAEVAAIEAWRSRPDIREQLQLELGNAFIVREAFDNLGTALAAARANLTK